MTDTSAVRLKQNPHSTRGEKERKLEVSIGREVRTLRQSIGITVADLSVSCGISVGMLSKIENGVISPSLTTLQALAQALGVPLTYLMRKFEEERSVVQVKSGTGVEMERRGTRAGHQYKLLGYLSTNTSGVVSEPYMITLSDAGDEFPAFQHDGVEYLYMLQGAVEYRHGDKTYLMEPGDSLFFDADAPHGPEKLIDLPVQYLSVISYPQVNQKTS